MSKILASGKIWPYAIGISIMLIFGACVATVVTAAKLPVQKSDTYMMGYQEADANANDLINARIAFDKKYKIEYVTDGLSQENSVLKYKVTDIDGNIVNNAKLKVVVTRPNSHQYDQELQKYKFENGVYVFDSIKLEVPGRWDIMAKVNVDNLERFYNVKADTRAKEAYEY
ncbi:MAG: FixH family protein [Thiovulaceae bacterium]|nr:FixH family protein [Sulfurimonadaceae bacterium]